MARDKNPKVDAGEMESKQTRRAMVGLLGVSVAAGAVAVGAEDAVAQEQRMAAPGRAAGALQRIVNDPNLLTQLETARSAGQRKAILAQAGLDGAPNPEEVYRTLSQMLAKHGRPGGNITPHMFGKNDWGPVGPAAKPVEWVAALATAAALFV